MTTLRKIMKEDSTYSIRMGLSAAVIFLLHSFNIVLPAVVFILIVSFGLFFMGRPQKSVDKPLDRYRLSAVIPIELHERIVRITERDKCTITSLVIKALSMFLKAEEEKQQESVAPTLQ